MISREQLQEAQQTWFKERNVMKIEKQIQEDDYPKWELIDGAWWYDGACWPPEAVPEEIRNQSTETNQGEE